MGKNYAREDFRWPDRFYGRPFNRVDEHKKATDIVWLKCKQSILKFWPNILVDPNFIAADRAKKIFFCRIYTDVHIEERKQRLEILPYRALSAVDESASKIE